MRREQVSNTVLNIQQEMEYGIQSLVGDGNMGDFPIAKLPASDGAAKN